MSSNVPPGYGYPGDGSGQSPYGQQPPQDNPYGQPQYPQPSYPQDSYGQQPPNPYGPPLYGPQTPPPGATGPQAQSPYPQNPYPQQPPQAPYGQQPYGGGPAMPGAPVLANAGDRLLAKLIDSAVMLIPFIVLYVLIAPTSLILFYVTFGAAITAYEGLMLSQQHGQTVGKKVMKLWVVNLADGRVPSAGTAWARAAVYGGPQAVYCLGSLFTLVNVLWQLWDKPNQQCLHDKAAKTVVVKVG